MRYMSETWDYPDAQFCQPCPHCGSQMLWGSVTDWPAQLGGEYIGDYVECSGCKTRWECFHNDEHGCDGYPQGCFDDNDLLVGWSQDGYFINGCEGPILEREQYSERTQQ